jgi:hypothetical protein
MSAREESAFEWWLKYVLLIVLLTGAGLAAYNHERLHVYQAYFRDKSPEIRMRYELLSPDMDEAAVRRHFPDVPLRCEAEPSSLGDRVCYASVEMADGVPALGVALFFEQGRLRRSLIQVPWWRHLLQKQRLETVHGPAPRQSGQPVLMAWPMPRGLLVFNRDRVSRWNPLAWSVVMWHAAVPKEQAR